ncbi:MAG: Tar ligand binding domain-containing protein [Halomonas sp.]|uniref:methyl-accepting chemotaxis protein n=1 Tax=Halomonas sp. TaxID=1486246 RepID=UPI001A024345|nr:methyl-accepting chemotaxis protein [Halomonas sp.]MBE0490084.1 Tar ligand binding domain-containing protein [Halomonas sp.]
MVRFIRNISIHAAMVAVLACFVIFIAAIAAMGVIADRNAGRTLHTLNQISAEQLNEINRAYALMNVGRNHLEIASNLIMIGRMGEANAHLDSAMDRFGRAEQRFQAFVATPKMNDGALLADRVEEQFTAVIELLRRQHTALDQLDTTTFNRLREELNVPSTALDAAMTEFVAYGFARADGMIRDFRDQVQRFEWFGLGLLTLIGLLVVMIYVGLRRVVIRPLDAAVANLEAIAEADLSREIQVLGRNEISRLFAAMRKMQEGLARVVGEVRQGSGSIHFGTREIASGNADLSSRTEQQAASLEETAASMEQITATVKQNADNARQASGLALEASTTAERGGEVVDRVVKTMHGISDSSRKIADITGVIDSIAFQTNILALNASVEAARAGEQGRGFAVVAGEVRNLASRSAEAAKEIKTLIESSVAQVQAGSSLDENAGETMDEVVQAVRRVTDIMDEISAASQEQSDGIEQVSQAVGQMDQVTQQNAALVQEASAAASSLEEQAGRLEQAVARFRLAGEAARIASEPAPEALTLSAPGARVGLPVPSRRHSTRRAESAEEEWQEF